MRLGTTNKLIKYIIHIFNEASPGLFHECPYKSVNVTKASFKIPNPGSVFPSGDYKADIIQHDKNSKFMFKMDFAVTMNSAEKSSFG